MLIYSEWMKNYIALPKKMDALFERLTYVGLEVEASSQRACDTSHLRVAQVIESQKHPNADRLSLCNVKTKEGVSKVVCGAKNYKVGDKVILALPGALLANGLKIKVSKIRGEESFGMLCSEAELGFQKEAAGIMILPSQTSLSANINKVLGIGEAVFELNVTPNRGDCLSFLGVAREISVITSKPVRFPKIKIKETQTKITTKVKVKLQDSQKCPRYMGRLIEGVKVEPSPAWLVAYLGAVGQRSINNVVDITNFVLLEYGQPLHAFDFDKIEGGQVVIRKAKPAETMKTLDDETRKLEVSDLVIADAKKPIALAGVMGGQTSEVSESTTNIFLESAYFDPKTIRATSKRLGLNSESSKRFEKGVDIAAVYFAMERATQLISEIASGKVAKGWVDAYPKKIRPPLVSLEKTLLHQYLGYPLNFTTAKAHLQKLGFRATSFSSTKATFQVPTYREDVTQSVDLIEEVARIEGYDKIPTLEPTGKVNLEQIISPKGTVVEKKTKEILTGMGLNEVVHLSFCSPDDLKKVGWTEPVTKISNPIGQDTSVMRPTLIVSLLNGLALNLRQQTGDVQIFELRNVYDGKGKQKKRLAGLLSGRRHPSSWDVKEAECDFFDLKAKLSSLFGRLNLSGVRFNKVQENVKPYLHPGWSAQFEKGKTPLAFIGKLHPDVQDKFHLKQAAFLFDLDFDMLVELCSHSVSYQPLPKYPSVSRDISLLVPENISHQQVSSVIVGQAGAILKSVELFDIYQGKQIASGAKSLAYSLLFQSDQRTLTDDEVNKVHLRICETLKNKLNAQIR